MNARALDIRKFACLAEAILREHVNAKLKCFFPPPGTREATTSDWTRHVRLSSTAAPKTACKIRSMRDQLLKLPMTLVTRTCNPNGAAVHMLPANIPFMATPISTPSIHLPGYVRLSPVMSGYARIKMRKTAAPFISAL
jgi:hypothetical protein